VGDKLGVREFLVLRDRGVRTLDDLAEVDVDALLAGDGSDDTADTVDTAHLAGRRQRLYRAIVAAQLIRDGAVLRLKPEAVIDIPVADIEVDLDIEWSRDGHVYLWGALLTDAGGSRYVSFFDLTVGDTESEARLARRCLDWLDGVAHAAATQGRSMLVFHYWIPEPAKAREYLPRPEGSSHPDSWVDLLPYVRAAIDSRYGHGLKVIAQTGAGHRWRDSDPGGLQSQDWHAQALQGPPEERQRAAERLLAYNEDDVWATLRVRRWLQDEAARRVQP
jgi:predicted RecB family nuclease